VVIPVHDRTRFLSEAIASVRAQTMAGEIEIIVVDDGSQRDVRREVGEVLRDCRLVRQEQAGVCAARNHGVREARAEIVAVLDDDDVLRPEALEIFRRVFARHQEVSFVFADFSWFPAEGPPEPGRRGMAGHRCLLREGPHEIVGDDPPIYLLPPKAALPFFVLGKPMFASALAFRKGALAAMGGWDESLHGRECHEFSVRAGYYNHCAFVDRDLMALRRGHEDHITRDMLDGDYREAEALCTTLPSYPRDLRRRAAPLIGLHCIRVGRRLLGAGRRRQGLRLVGCGVRTVNVRLIAHLARSLGRRLRRRRGIPR
jgi:glycosyltransferase involved in cell wall biosynthesis